ncbi:MAG: HD domain-containing protein [Acidobacteria bacterium]|nr:HD domain-containing protein [Acidobacteriota bacterium]
MKTKYVQDCQPNDRVVSFFLVQSKEVRFKKNSGEPYLSLVLSDRTGQVEAKMWDGVEDVLETFDRDDFVKVKANIQLYRDKPQMIIQRLRRAEESEIDLADYMPHTKRDIDEMLAELRAAFSGFSNPDLKALALSVLDDEEIVGKLRVAPAAKSLHHACVGGLLEHVCSLMNLARLVASNYDYLDLDLIQTGVLFHDICKIDELTYERSFGYSSDGQLLGHISMALQLVDRKCSALPGFPPRLKRLVEHMVLSHHGRYEFGSPKLPMFPEALALSYIDDLDSKLESMRASLDAELGVEPEWTRYNPSLERPILNVARYLNGPAPEQGETEGSEAKDSDGDDNESEWMAPPPPPPLPLSAPAPDALAGPAPTTAKQQKKVDLSQGLFGEKLQMALSQKGPKE